MDNAPSIASLLIRQSPSMHYGNGWIAGKNGKRWHPCHDQSALLNELHSGAKVSISRRILRFFWMRYEQKYYIRAN